MKFTAAVLDRVNTPLTLDTLEMAALQPTDVLVKIRASGLCHTDLEVIQGSLAYPMPIVLGHEGAGVVEAVGKNVTQVKVGDHVVCSWNPNCGHCFYCDRSLPILCEPFRRHQPQGLLLDGTTRMTRGGEKVHHYSVTSTHAEYTVVPESGAIAVPKEIPFDRACLIGCGVMTGIGAVMRKAKVPAGSSVAVIGCGAVGLNVIQGAVLSDAAPIVAIDRDPAKLERAMEFGANATLDASAPDLLERLRSLTGGRGADYVFEAAGHKSSFPLSLEAVRPGGEVVWLGKINVDDEVTFRWGMLMGEKRIVRSSYGGAVPRRDFPWIAREYLEGRVKLDPLITRRIALHEINDGFALLARGEGIRTVVEFAEAALGDLALESGESILDYRQSYVTHGELDRDGRNAILICASLTGNHHRLDFLIGPGKALDPARWYIVATDPIGNGLSTSPSTSERQPRMRFPRFSIRDMVHAQHRLLEESLGIRELHAVVGASMGGMQALQWAVSHPDFMRCVVAMTPMAKTAPWAVLVTETARACLTADAAWNGDGFDGVPERGWRAYHGLMSALVTRTPRALEESLAGVDEAHRWFDEIVAKQRALGFDAHDYLYQSWAYEAHDVGTTRGFGGDTQRALASIKAKALLLAPPLDLFNPSESGRDAAKAIPGATFVEIPSDQGHQAATQLRSEDTAFLNQTIGTFLHAA